MLNFRKNNGKLETVKEEKSFKSVSIHDIADGVDDLKDSLEDFLGQFHKYVNEMEAASKLRIENLKDEIADLRKEIKEKNKFIENLVMQLIDQGAAKKPLSATEAYLAKKAADGSKPIPLPGK